VKKARTRGGAATSEPDLRAVILAGGRGTRFWPLGRVGRPKQFLPIAGRKTMVEDTVGRLRPLVPPARTLLVADDGQTRTLRRIFPKFPRTSFLVEPLARNTAPSLMLASAKVWLENPSAVIAVLPADHLIREPVKFRDKLRAAAAFAAREPSFVTFGIRPTYPATGYGYIQFSKDGARRLGREAFYPVRAFREKPSLEAAEGLLAAGGCAWNSGMFLWRADVFAEKLEAFAPDLWPVWGRMVDALKRKDAGRLRKAFELAPAISIDYALMEKARGVFVCEGDFGWSDVGAWSSLFRIWKADGQGNVARGDYLALDASGCLVYNPGGLTALIGVRDLIVVEAGGALLICPAGQDQRVREVVETLRKSKKRRYL
jgi:mannose-1-phosphate guanylyltransferase